MTASITMSGCKTIVIKFLDLKSMFQIK